MGILAALKLYEVQDPYLDSGSDALAVLFREDNWKDAKEVVADGCSAKEIRDFRLLATVMSAWEAFFNVSINNRWGVAHQGNGNYLLSSCLVNLEALTAEATELNIFREMGDTEVSF